MSIISHVYTFHVYITCLLYMNILYICFFRYMMSAFFLICRLVTLETFFQTLIHAGDLDICLLAPDVTTSASQACPSVGPSTKCPGAKPKTSRGISENSGTSQFLYVHHLPVIISSKILPLYFFVASTIWVHNASWLAWDYTARSRGFSSGKLLGEGKTGSQRCSPLLIISS